MLPDIVFHVHVCPSCGMRHAVNAARHSVAYGRALACSPECESLRRRLARGVQDCARRDPPCAGWRA